MQPQQLSTPSAKSLLDSFTSNQATLSNLGRQEDVRDVIMIVSLDLGALLNRILPCAELE